MNPRPHWDEAIGSWTAFMRSGGRPDSTIYIRTYHVKRFARMRPDLSPYTVELDDLTEWMAGFTWAPETRRSYRASLRQFYGWAHATGRMLTNPAALLPSITPPRAYPRPTPEDVYHDARDHARERERIMIRLATNCGMRVGEIARAQRDWIAPDNDGGWAIYVVGKGRKVRKVPLLDDLAAELRRYPSGPLFPGQIDGHLSAGYVSKLLSRSLGPGWVGHTLRHRFACRTYAQDRDLRAVQELLGHASIVTTQTYTEVPSGALRRAVLAAA